MGKKNERDWDPIELEMLYQKVSQAVVKKPTARKAKRSRLGWFGNTKKIDWDLSSCKRLKEAIKKFGKSWVHVAAYVGN